MLALACLLQKILGIQGEFLEKMMMMLIYQGVPIKNRGMMIPPCGFRMAEGTTPGFCDPLQGAPVVLHLPNKTNLAINDGPVIYIYIYTYIYIKMCIYIYI